MSEKNEQVKNEQVEAVEQETPSKAAQIRALYLQGLNYYQIAKALHIRPQYSRNVILNAVESGHKTIKAEFERRMKKETK